MSADTLTYLEQYAPGWVLDTMTLADLVATADTEATPTE